MQCLSSAGSSTFPAPRRPEEGGALPLLASSGTELRPSTQVLMAPTMAHKRASPQRNVKGLITASQMVMARREVAYGMVAGCPNRVRTLVSRLPVCHKENLPMPIVYGSMASLSDESTLMKANKSVMDVVISSQLQKTSR